MRKMVIALLCASGAVFLASCSGLVDLFTPPAGTIEVVSSTPIQGARIANKQQVTLTVKYDCAVSTASQYLLKTDIRGSDGSYTSTFKDQVLIGHAGTVTVGGMFDTTFNPPSPYTVSLVLAYQTTDTLIGSPTYGQTIWKQDTTKDIPAYYTK